MESELKEMLASLERTGYCQWMKGEGVPIAEGFSVENVCELKLSPWRRLGGSGAFVHLYGMEGQTGMYVAEIPPGGALNPERHLYEEMICILAGHGATEIWQEGGQKRLFEWGPFSLFATGQRRPRAGATDGGNHRAGCDGFLSQPGIHL